MRATLSRIRLRDLALFVVVSGVVAVAAVFAAREDGVGGGAAVAEVEPLTLTLTTQTQICETERARQRGSSQLRTNEHGVRVRESVTIGWFSETELPVRWHVRGGMAPNTLVIDGESRDVRHHCAGPLGTAKVGCADTSGGTFFEERSVVLGVLRFYREDPEIDSGLKTIRAVVTDADGAIDEAAVEVYVILVDPVVMTRGETYRVFGHLITAPATHDLRNGSISDRECDDAGLRCETQIQIALSTTEVEARLFLFLSDGAESGRWQILSDGTVIEGRFSGAMGAAGESDVDAAFDLVAGSVGNEPEASWGVACETPCACDHHWCCPRSRCARHGTEQHLGLRPVVESGG